MNLCIGTGITQSNKAWKEQCDREKEREREMAVLTHSKCSFSDTIAETDLMLTMLTIHPTYKQELQSMLLEKAKENINAWFLR